jgi:hypothetical protein
MFDFLAQSYRASVFGIHGFFNFTKQGFESASSSQRFKDSASDMQQSMKGKVAVVTGNIL